MVLKEKHIDGEKLPGLKAFVIENTPIELYTIYIDSERYFGAKVPTTMNYQEALELFSHIAQKETPHERRPVSAHYACMGKDYPLDVDMAEIERDVPEIDALRLQLKNKEYIIDYDPPLKEVTSFRIRIWDAEKSFPAYTLEILEKVLGNELPEYVKQDLAEFEKQLAS